MATLQDLAQAVIEGDDSGAVKHTQTALDAGVPVKVILNEGLLAGMGEVGRRFREGEYFIPEVLIAVDAMKRCMTLLEPHMLREGVKAAATELAGTVQGDLHDIGKNLVATMLQGAGFEVIDLGVDVSPQRFVQACCERPVQLVAISALLTTTMPAMADVIRQLRQEVNPCPVILVGGAPVTQAYADQIGADGYARDAATGAELAKNLCLSAA